MNIVQQAKQIKDSIEELKNKGVRILDNTRESAELEILIRDKNKIQSDLKPRGIKWEDV